MWRCDVVDTLSVRLLGANNRWRGQICANLVKAPYNHIDIQSIEAWKVAFAGNWRLRRPGLNIAGVIQGTFALKSILRGFPVSERAGRLVYSTICR